MLKTVTLSTASLASFLLSACEVSYPVAVIGPEGTTFRGFASDTVPHRGFFSGTNGGTSCSHTNQRAVDMTDVSFPVRCSNFLTGVGKATFETGASGAGTVHMVDGSAWQFIFGRRAAGI
ncbi:MAG: hypothetical protein AAFP13_00825 [Pseudomonadota bacterium]